VDGWVGEVASEPFDDLLPVLRRTFAAFGVAERRMIGDRVRHLDGSRTVAAGRDDDIDPERAQRVAPVLRAILGVQP
jgi:hypothetical protein